MYFWGPEAMRGNNFKDRRLFHWFSHNSEWSVDPTIYMSSTYGFLRLWKNKHVSRKPCNLRSYLDFYLLWICLWVWNTANSYMTCQTISKKQGKVVTLQYVQAVPQCRKGAQAGFARLWSAWGRLSYSHRCALNPSIIEAFFFFLAYNQSV